MNISMKVRLQQGDIVEALEKRGWTQKQGADFLGLSPIRFNALINLRWIPKNFSPELTIKLYELTGKTAEELFPEWARQQNFLELPKVARKMMEVGPHMLNGAGTFYLPPGPEEVFSQEQVMKRLNEMLLRLSPRNEKIIKMLFFEGMSFDQVGEHFGITADRVRLLKEKSLRRLRKPDVIQSLKEVV